MAKDVIFLQNSNHRTLENRGGVVPYITLCPTSNARTSYLDPTSLLLDLLDKDSEKQLQDFYMIYEYMIYEYMIYEYIYIYTCIIYTSMANHQSPDEGISPVLARN